MGVVWSQGIKCDRFSMNKLIDNEKWFGATLIEYNSLSAPAGYDWNLSLRRNYECRRSTAGNLRQIFKKQTKCYGRISVHDNCIVFQGLRCTDLLKAIISRKDRSHSSQDKSLSGSPTSIMNEPNYYTSRYSQSPTNKDFTDPPSTDCLNTFVWPMNTIRHFGYKNDFFSFDSGRFSPTGEGRFTFKLKNAATFLTLFQNTYSRCSQTSAHTYSTASSETSPPYYNLTNSHSYRNISQLSTTPIVVGDCDNQFRFKTASKSIEFTLDNTKRNANNNDSVFPVNYSSIDFSHSSVNTKEKTMPKLGFREKNGDFKRQVRDSIYYLTICENQTKAVEEVLKRIG